MSLLPKMQKAWVRTQRGHFNACLQLDTKYPTPNLPDPSSADVIVQISAVALEYASIYLLPMVPRLPFAPLLTIPEMQFAGTIVAAGGKASDDVRPAGTTVVGTLHVPEQLGGKGVLCDYVQLHASQVVPMPDTVTMEEGAGVVACGQTALAMVRRATVKAGDRVLVNGASGAVGNLVVQIAKQRRAHVVAVASGRNEQLVRSLGADEFVDYTTLSSLPARLKETYGDKSFNHILDCVGSHALYANSPDYLHPNGLFINVGAFEGLWTSLYHWFSNTWTPVWLGGTPRTYVMFSTPQSREGVVELLRMVEDKQIRVIIDSVWKMEDAKKGYAVIETKRARGKVIIKVNELK